VRAALDAWVDSDRVTPAASLYRRHRPQSFDEVVGQEHVVRTLRNAVERDRVHHAYLFVGSRGTGKTSLAKILARSLNCVNGPTLTPCGECESCVTIAAGSSMDVIEMDAASNRSVEDIRDLRERVGYAPAAGRWKVYILDEAHMLTREAWNAFLKTLEEPPPNTTFVLATTEPHKVMPTIVDRCQRFDFQRPSLDQIAEVIRRVATAEQIEIEDGAVSAISRAATGSFRDALGTLDQLVSYGGKRVATDDVLAVLGVAEAEVILAAADAIAAGDGRGVLEASERLSRSGRDPSQFGRDLLAHLRQLLVIRAADDVVDDFTVTAADPERLRSQADSFTDLGLIRAIDSIAGALAAIREGDEARMTVELALLRAARPQLDPSKEALLQRIEALEAGSASPAGGAGGAGAPPASPSGATDEHAHPAPPQARQAEHSHPSPADDESTAASPHSTGGGGEEPTSTRPRSTDGGEGEAEAGGESELDLERLRELWPAMVDQLRQSGSELLSHVLEAARPVAVDVEEAVLKVGFPASAAFNKRKAEAAEARDRFADAARAILGERLKPVYVLLDSDEDGGDHEPAPLSEDELIERLKSEFDADEVADDEKSDPPAKEATA
jgi:DNA polymerase-3 subunit gamma/tau